MRSNPITKPLIGVIFLTLSGGCKLTTYALQKPYVGESTKCVWQSRSPQGQGQCPPYVTYYNGTQTATLKLSVKNNLIYNVNGQPFDTTYADPTGITGRRAAIFVVSGSGDLYASNQNKVFLFHHSTILAGDPVAAAGEVQASKGIISVITNCSGHYKPDKDVTKTQVTKILKDMGYTRTFTYTPCTPAEMERYRLEVSAE